MTNNIILTSDSKEMIHLVLSTLAFAVFCTAALQALMLAIQERWLRHKQASDIARFLPPLEKIENGLFRLILLGFTLLTLIIITSVITFQHVFITPWLPKTLLSLLTWLVFAVLLVGRHYFGWRGQIAIRWTLSGVFLIIIAYLGTILLTKV